MSFKALAYSIINGMRMVYDHEYHRVYAGILIMSSFFRLLACIAPSMVIAQVSCSFAILLNLRVAAVRLPSQHCRLAANLDSNLRVRRALEPSRCSSSSSPQAS